MRKDKLQDCISPSKTGEIVKTKGGLASNYFLREDGKEVTTKAAGEASRVVGERTVLPQQTTYRILVNKRREPFKPRDKSYENVSKSLARSLGNQDVYVMVITSEKAYVAYRKYLQNNIAKHYGEAMGAL